jgi:hypothetical protein
VLFFVPLIEVLLYNNAGVQKVQESGFRLSRSHPGIMIRNLLQVVPSPEKKRVTADSLGLVEVGPRLTLNPIKILEGSFGGPVLYSNPTYVSPNLVSPGLCSF